MSGFKISPLLVIVVLVGVAFASWTGHAQAAGPIAPKPRYRDPVLDDTADPERPRTIVHRTSTYLFTWQTRGHHYAG
jgi:hypothetical protein